MIDYIMRLDALIDVCIGCNEEFPNEPCEPNDCKIKRALSGIPTADVRKNVKGQWLDYWDNPIKSYFDGRYSTHCSVCGYHPEYEEEMHSANFCPNCGAEMVRGES